MSCKFCGKVFNRSFNLRRHERENCTLKDRRSHEMDFEDNFSTSSIDSESESLMATDNEGESEEQLDPWVPLIEEAKRRSDIVLENVKEILINSGIDEQTAREEPIKFRESRHSKANPSSRQYTPNNSDRY